MEASKYKKSIQWLKKISPSPGRETIRWVWLPVSLFLFGLLLIAMIEKVW
ncbi:MAG TPA: hypothetical protein VGO58_02045 [Chitinophagaceae bacterium]|jgi:hypothetical protein|nr:hypothetical protein [Chitinophagaceae bacterium]